MIKWLSGLGSALAAAAIAFLAFMAINQRTGYKRTANKWRQRAEDELVSGRDDALERAKSARRQAGQHERLADEARGKAEKRIDELGKKNEDVADIVSRWRKPERVRSTDF